MAFMPTPRLVQTKLYKVAPVLARASTCIHYSEQQSERSAYNQKWAFSAIVISIAAQQTKANAKWSRTQLQMQRF